ncbi:MAG: hypothetical protein WCR55_01385 [Lentisphaerota bacterium]
MKKTIALLFIGISMLLLGACAKDATRPYNPLSTANTPTAGQSQDSGLVGYSNFDSAVTDKSYTQDKVSTEVKPLLSSGVSK